MGALADVVPIGLVEEIYDGYLSSITHREVRRYTEGYRVAEAALADEVVAEKVDAIIFADCAARSFFDQVGNKWSVMILTLLNEKPTRFNEIRRRLEGITHKALSQALRRLERNGLIKRKVIASSQVAVEYSITDLGRTLQVPFGAVYDWTIENLREIEKARKAYDERAEV